jgi:hypothetical protein
MAALCENVANGLMGRTNPANLKGKPTMSNRTDRHPFFGDSRRKLLSLCLLTALATPCAQAKQAVGNPNATVSSDAVSIDPNGLEMDSASAIDRALPSETTDIVLLMICAALALAMAGIGVADERRPKQPANAPALGEPESHHSQLK